jgi:hypothetical protein
LSTLKEVNWSNDRTLLLRHSLRIGAFTFLLRVV